MIPFDITSAWGGLLLYVFLNIRIACHSRKDRKCLHSQKITGTFARK